MARFFAVCGAVYGCLAVVAGSFAAHGLEAFLAARGLEGAVLAKQIANFDTGARHQMHHALALLATAWVCSRRPGRPTLPAAVAGVGFVVGGSLFPGSLYLLAATQVKAFAHIAPIGGASLVVGWIALALAAATWPASQEPDSPA